MSESTVILATHQIAFLAEADLIIVMADVSRSTHHSNYTPKTSRDLNLTALVAFLLFEEHREPRSEKKPL